MYQGSSSSIPAFPCLFLIQVILEMATFTLDPIVKIAIKEQANVLFTQPFIYRFRNKNVPYILIFFKYLLWNLSWQHTVKIDKRTIVNNHYCFYTVSHRRTISSLKTEIKCLKKGMKCTYSLSMTPGHRKCNKREWLCSA